MSKKSEKKDSNSNIDENSEVEKDEEVGEASPKEEDLSVKVEELEQKIAIQEDKYLRVHADFENTKKRLEREKYQGMEYAVEEFAKDLLSVVDSLELALNSVEKIEEVNKESFDNLKKGVELTLEQLNKVFSKQYVEIISTEDGFDPHIHNAIMQEENEECEAGEIVKVMQKGYKLRDRVLRPSMVSICKK